ncbi:MAG: hypothetical protein SWY16_26685 [Cyanobacteriota bacterium]|nr:hypothetical protein [Cyanobacteriota bacterium]
MPSPRKDRKRSTPLSKDLIFSQFDSSDPFPIDFDDAWQWLGFGTKYDAKVSLKSAGFSESIDFRSFQESSGKLRGGRPAEQIFLTIDCFKTWAMMANTHRGNRCINFPRVGRA